MRVIASITHTIGGLRVDERARVLREDGTPVAGLWAAGVDAGGVATGGYASGLAQALVLGLAAARGRAASQVSLTRCRCQTDRPSGFADGEGAGAVVAGQRRGADLVHDERALAVLELVPDLRRVAVASRASV